MGGLHYHAILAMKHHVGVSGFVTDQHRSAHGMTLCCSAAKRIVLRKKNQGFA